MPLDSHGLIGESAPIQSVKNIIDRVADTDITVLITGESGTGKELVARAIHAASSRADKPFIAINCAAIPETLIESELFGHERGAFTGAASYRKGKFELADGGTIFLDEVSEIPIDMQVKLLRVLQEMAFERVGGSRLIKVNIRILAAANRNLKEMVSIGKFREDLFYRLDVISLNLPPLRDRGDDILLLASYFLHKLSRKTKRHVRGLSPATSELLKKYDWPGNVRELENVIEYAIALGSTELIQPNDLPERLCEFEATHNASPSSAGGSGNVYNFHKSLREAKKKIILNALSHAGGNFTLAARLLEIHPSNLHRIIRSLGLRQSLKEQEILK